MAVKIVADLRGVELRLGRIGPELRKGAQEALNKIAKLAADGAEQAAPEGPTGNLKKDIGWRENPQQDGAGNVVPAADAFSRAPHSHLVEFGTGPRVRKSGGSTGVMPANPFFSRAVRSARRKGRGIAIQAGRQTMRKIRGR